MSKTTIMPFTAAAAAAALTGCLAGSVPARADHQPVIAVPGNWQVPVIINGVNATYAVVEGDWGLYAPGRVAPTIYGPVYMPPPVVPRAYFPSTGKRPRYGRLEVQPSGHRILPPAPTFYRQWDTQSGSAPATEYPPFDPPPVIMAPRNKR